MKRSTQRSPITGFRHKAGQARSFLETQNICHRCHHVYTPGHYSAHVKSSAHRSRR